MTDRINELSAYVLQVMQDGRPRLYEDIFNRAKQDKRPMSRDDVKRAMKHLVERGDLTMEISKTGRIRIFDLAEGVSS